MSVDHMISVMLSRSCDAGTEAHGGYTFCGFAALVLLGKPHLCDVKKLLVSKSIGSCVATTTLFKCDLLSKLWVMYTKLICRQEMFRRGKVLRMVYTSLNQWKSFAV